MIAEITAALFWLCVIGVVYAYAGYPVIVWLFARVFGRVRNIPADRPSLGQPSRLAGPMYAGVAVGRGVQLGAGVADQADQSERRHEGDGPLDRQQPPLDAADVRASEAAADAPGGLEPPFVSVLIAAHNEEQVIAERLANALALDYPADRLEIVVASDGSTDATVAIARATGDPRVRVLDYRERRGKATVLNAVIPTLASDLVILSDANTAMESSAVRRFVRWFSDETIGVVVGRLVLTDPATGRNVDSLYWRYETFLKQMDARLGALLGANGAIYALRRRLFVPMPADTLVDDLVLPLLVRLTHCAALVYDRHIVAHEETPAQIRSEFTRRRRIGTGGFQSLAVLWPLLSPARGWIAFTFFSHKVLRWICPFLLIGALATNALLLDRSAYRLAFLAQAMFYTTALAGCAISGSGRTQRMVRLTTMFTSMNVALLTGCLRWATGVSSGTWTRTARTTRMSQAKRVDADAAPIRVVHLVIALEIGGLEMVVANLARQISRRFELHVICLEGLGPIAARLAPGVSIECIGTPDTSIVRSVVRLRRRLAALRPDVVHTHNEKAHIRGMLATAGWRGTPALVHTRHGRSRAAGWVAMLANRLAIWRSRFMVSVSEDAAAILRAEGTRDTRIRVIRNGIDLDMRNESVSVRSRAVTVARLAPVKDFVTMLRAVRIVADAEPGFHLDIVGDGPSRVELEALCRSLGLERCVTFHGATDDVRRFLGGARLFVQSSLSEGVSLTLLEAMAAALPIVATRVGGTPEVVEHGVTGLLVAPRDPGGLAAAMLTILRDDGLTRSMAAAARARVEKMFSLRQMTRAYESLYEDVLAREGVRAGSAYRVS